MKKITYLLIICISILSACTHHKNEENKNIIRVGIFDTNGDSPGCIADAYEALRIDSEINPEVISAATIMSDDILNYDLILFPGGSGKAETSRLGDLGQERIKELVSEHGKSVIGICAGAYILTQTEGYPSLDLSGMQATDIEHDHRGHGIVKFSLTEKGNEIFPELAEREISFMQYYEGPVLVPVENAKYNAQSLATMLSDVHTVEGTPSNMTNNKPFIITSEVGKGNTASFVGHPETTPGMRWMIPRMVRFLLNKELVAYSDVVVRPEIYKNEILFTDELLDIQSTYYSNLWGTEEEKIEAVNGLVEISAWSAKKKLVGLLRDISPEVRKATANALVQLERTDFIHDLEVAVQVEKNEEVKIFLAEKLKQLQLILPE